MDKFDEDILRRLSQSIVGVAPAALCRRLPISHSEMNARLRKLEQRGFIERNGANWTTTERAPVVHPPSTPGPRNRSTRAAVRKVKKSLSNSDSGPWSTFRRLCEYYAECIRLDQGTTVHGKANEENQKFVCVSTLHGREVEQGWKSFSVPKSWSMFAREAQKHKTVLMGYPVHRYHWKDTTSEAETTYLSPIFIMPFECRIQGELLSIRRLGRLRVNEGWLQRRFRDVDDRRAFLEICGFIADPNAPIDLGGEPELREAASLLRKYYPELCVDHLHLDHLRTTHVDTDTRDGIYNRGLLLIPRKVKFVQRLCDELIRIARTTSDEDLAKSALRTVFPGGEINSEVSGTSSPLGYASVLPLNREQRRACEAASNRTLTVIYGPPGTGKSQTVSAILAQAAIRSESALFTSRNHQALEAVVPRLNAITESHPLILRLAYPWGASTDASLVHVVNEIISRPPQVDVDNHSASMVQTRTARLVEWCLKARDIESRIDEGHELREGLRDAIANVALQLVDIPGPLKDAIFGASETFPSLATVEAAAQSLRPVGDAGSNLTRWLARLRFTFCKKRLVRQAWFVDQQARSQLLPTHPAPDLAYSDSAIDVLHRVLRFWQPVASAAEAIRSSVTLRKNFESFADMSETYQAAADVVAQIRTETAELLRTIALSGTSHLTDEERQQLAEFVAALSNKSAADSEYDRRRFEKYQSRSLSVLKKHVPILASTNLSVGRDLPLAAAGIDMLVVDEASQCDIASIIPLLYRCRRAVFVGDPMQLPHVTSLPAATDRQLRQQFGVAADELERFSYRSTSAFQLANTSGFPPMRVMLQQHHRCHTDIAEYCNSEFYKGRLVVLTSQRRGGMKWTNTADDTASAAGGGCTSQSQITAVRKELHRLESQKFEGSIGVVTPFRQQANRMRDQIWAEFSQDQLGKWRVLVDTADGFQGDERDVILFSLVGGQNMPQGSLRFLSSTPNRFNVAVSRAKSLLHVFGNSDWASSCGVQHVEHLLKAVRKSEQRLDGNAPFRADLVGPVWEPKLADTMRQAGISFQQQYPACGRYLDFAIIQGNIKLNIEVDGETFHRAADGTRRTDDRERDQVLVADGWVVRRFWVYELREDMKACVAEIKRLLDDVKM